MNTKSLSKCGLVLIALSGSLFFSATAKASATRPKNIRISSVSDLKVGDTGSIKATKKAKKHTASEIYVTFSPKRTKNTGFIVKSSNASILSVKKVSNHKYSYSALKEGEVTLTVTSLAKNKNGKKVKTKVNLKVIKPQSFSISQKTANDFNMQFSAPVKKMSVSEISIKDESGTSLSVSSVLLSEDRLSAVVTVKEGFKKGMKYQVSFADLSASFEAEIAPAPASLVIETGEVPVGSPSAIAFKALDRDGTDITKTIDRSKFVVNVTTKNGEYDEKNNLLKLNDYDAQATVKIEYRENGTTLLSAERVVQVILDENYYTALDEEILHLKKDMPVIRDLKFELRRGDFGLQDEVITLTMSKPVEEKYKAFYEDKNNYKMSYTNLYSDTFVSIDDAKAPTKNIQVAGDKITITIANENDGVIGNIHLKLNVATIGRLRYSEASFTHDFRNRKYPDYHGAADATNKYTSLSLSDANPDTIKLEFKTPVLYKGPEKTELEFKGENSSLIKKKATVTFDTAKNTLIVRFDGADKHFGRDLDRFDCSIPNLYSLGGESDNDVIEEGKSFQAVLTCTYAQENGGSTKFLKNKIVGASN